MRKFLFLMAAVMLASTAIAQYTLLEWSAPLTGDPVVKYRIYKGSDSMSLALYDSVMGDPADTEYVDEVIDEDESVYYRVRGLDAEGRVGTVTVLNETLVDLTPNTPTQLYTDGNITMNWSALANATEHSVADADSYRIRWMYGASAWTYDSEPVVAGEVEFTLGTVEAHETYVIQAMAVYGGWPADWSTTVGDTVQVSTSGSSIMATAARLYFATGATGDGRIYQIGVYGANRDLIATAEPCTTSGSDTQTLSGNFDEAFEIVSGETYYIVLLPLDSGSVSVLPGDNLARYYNSSGSFTDPLPSPGTNWNNGGPCVWLVDGDGGHIIGVSDTGDCGTNVSAIPNYINWTAAGYSLE